MSKEINLETVRSLILKIMPDEKRKQIQPNADLFDGGYLDSFSVMQLVQVFEEQFGIVFEYEDLRRDYFSTAEALLGLLTKKYGLQSTAPSISR